MTEIYDINGGLSKEIYWNCSLIAQAASKLPENWNSRKKNFAKRLYENDSIHFYSQIYTNLKSTRKSTIKIKDWFTGEDLSILRLVQQDWL